MNDNVKTIKKSHIFFSTVGLVIISIVILYSIGYRITPGLKIGKVGKVSITIPLGQTSLYIDESEKIVTKKDGETVNLLLSPKDHSIIIARESYYPWKKDFKVDSGKNVNLAAIFVSQNPSGSIITKNDPEYYKIRNSILNNKPANKNNPKQNLDGSVKIWIEENTIKAEVGGKTINVVKPETEIRNLTFYKDRSDSVIFSSGYGIFVIEISSVGSQNFMPIYKGTGPQFTIDDPDYIYVLDSDSIMQVII